MTANTTKKRGAPTKANCRLDPLKCGNLEIDWCLENPDDKCPNLEKMRLIRCP